VNETRTNHSVTISSEDARAALESINYHYIVMAKSAGTWRRKRPPQEELAEGCDKRCEELEALYRRIASAVPDESQP
jgi:hypothetical protein